MPITYACLPLSEEARQHLEAQLAREVAGSCQGLHWKKPENWHATLAVFDPECPAELILERTLQIVQNVGPSLAGAPISIGPAQVFSDSRTVWVSVDGAARYEPLAQAMRALQGEIAPERWMAPSWTPHVSIAEFGAEERQEESVLSALRNYRGPSWVPGVVELRRSGQQPSHAVLGSIRLPLPSA